MCSLAGGRAPESGVPAAKEQQKRLSLTVHDNWPAIIPVTEREIEVIETYMSNVLDAVLAQCKVER